LRFIVFIPAVDREAYGLGLRQLEQHQGPVTRARAMRRQQRGLSVLAFRLIEISSKEMAAARIS
jgi:hypothetical protein